MEVSQERVNYRRSTEGNSDSPLTYLSLASPSLTLKNNSMEKINIEELKTVLVNSNLGLGVSLYIQEMAMAINTLTEAPKPPQEETFRYDGYELHKMLQEESKLDEVARQWKKEALELAEIEESKPKFPIDSPMYKHIRDTFRSNEEAIRADERKKICACILEWADLNTSAIGDTSYPDLVEYVNSLK